MIPSHQRTTYSCREFEPVEVPLDLLISNGKIQLYPEAEKYFDLDYRTGRLVIAPKSYVGLIPLNNRLAIHVLPRFPVDNLFYFIKRASAVLRFIDGHIRGYDLISEPNADPIEVLAKRFAAVSEILLRIGLLRRYIESESSMPFSGTLNVSETISLYRSKGITYKHEWKSEELTDNILENSLIKSALLRVIEFLTGKNDNISRKQLIPLRQILGDFDSIPKLEDSFFLDELAIARIIKRLPFQYREYEQLIWFAFLIHSRRGLSLERVGNVNFDTFVVNLADVFEDYVRNIIADYFRFKDKLYSVKNGNKDQIPLFLNSNSSNKVKPDIYINYGKERLAVLDAKYKPSIKASDRYEVIAFCEALQVKKAIIISPMTDGVRSELLGKTAGGIEFWQVKINLAALDISTEENAFLQCIAGLLPITSLFAVA